MIVCLSLARVGRWLYWRIVDYASGVAVLMSLENNDMDTASSNSDTWEHVDLHEPLTLLYFTLHSETSDYKKIQIKCEETFLRLKAKLSKET